MRRVVLGVSVASGLVLSMAAQGQVKREFDSFKNQTTQKAEVRLSALSADTPGISLELEATTPGDKPITNTDKVNLTALVTYDMTRSSACAGAGVDALVDGKPLSLDKALPPFFYGGHAIVGSRKELTYGQMQSLANSKTAEFRICGKVYRLAPDQINTFKEFVSPTMQQASN